VGLPVARVALHKGARGPEEVRGLLPSGIEGGDPGSWMVIPAAGSTRPSTTATAVGVLE
jgi:hypothetical protein